MLRRQRYGKIVATLGPASHSEQMIETLLLKGADVFRLNFSHGSHEIHKQCYESIRRVEAKMKHPISILMDLQGPKLRIGTFAKDKVHLKAGDSFVFDTHVAPGIQEGCKGRVHLSHPELFQSLKAGDKMLLDDGLVRVVVVANTGEEIVTEVEVGGPLSNRKGINVPGVLLPLTAMTEKDKQDLVFGLGLGVDWVALSFVQRPEDMTNLRQMVGAKAGIIAKLEKPQALAHLDAIIALSDAVMVARGDLGVEVPPEQVPILQKGIIRSCLKAGKPVIVATQMLDSMMRAPFPTRAEASDVATAIYDGVDAVMLSGESALGAYPVEAVAMMDRIIHSVEQDPVYRQEREFHRYESGVTTSDAITAAARHVASTLKTSAIVTFTSSGSTTFSAARERPSVPILGVTPSMVTARKLCLVWGVHPILHHDVTNVTDMVTTACTLARTHGFSKDQERVIITAGIPFGASGKTNMLRIARVGVDAA